MDQIKWFRNIALIFSFVIFTSILPLGPAWSQTAANQGDIVGRITDIEGGQLLRYVPVQKDWAVTVEDTPFAPTDAIYSGDDTRAEFVIPESSLIRVGGDTQLELVHFGQEVTQADAASGKVRFWNKSPQSVVKITTPYGYVVGPAGTVFDLYIGDRTIEVVSIRGTVAFIHDTDQAKYQITAGSSSVIAGSKLVTSGPGQVAAGWNRWNEARDNMLAKRNLAGSESESYLPHELRAYRSDLDQHGNWKTVSYKGKSYKLWHPAGTEQDWAPFTAGAWMDYDGDNTWVPREPFGYVTMHYGDWLWVDNAWYWAPPGIGIGISSGCDSCWFPGRVGWLYTDDDVAWFPLGPYELFYAFNGWGPGTLVVSAADLNKIHVEMHNFEFAQHAVVVKQNALFSAGNYSHLMLKNAWHTIAAKFHPVAVLNGAVIKHYASNAQRFTVGKLKPTFQPRHGALTRIAYNAGVARRTSAISLKNIQSTVAQAKPGQFSQHVSLLPPSIGGKLLNQGGVKVAGTVASRHNPTQAAGPNMGAPQGPTKQSVHGPGAGLPKQGGLAGKMGIARPKTPPPPTATQRAARLHRVHSFKKARNAGPKRAIPRVSRARSYPRGRAHGVERQRAHWPTAVERAPRGNGANSALEPVRTPGPRGGNTRFRGRSPGYPPVSRSPGTRKRPQSFEQRRFQVRTPPRNRPRPPARTPGAFRGGAAEPWFPARPRRTSAPAFRPGPSPLGGSAPQRYRTAPRFSLPYRR